MNFLGKNLSWIVIVIIIVIIILIYFLIPWEKIKNKKQAKSDLINKPQKSETKTKIKPMHGIYNGFGGGQALRDRKLVLVLPKKDACALCRPFENKVLSLETYDKKYLTMSEAISKGYHHIGCTHIDDDFYPGKTTIGQKDFTEAEQVKNFQIKLEKYRFENQIRNLKYQLQNEQKKPEFEEQIAKLIEEFKSFCNTNDLEYDEERLNPYISDFLKFS